MIGFTDCAQAAIGRRLSGTGRRIVHRLRRGRVGPSPSAKRHYVGRRIASSSAACPRDVFVGPMLRRTVKE